MSQEELRDLFAMNAPEPPNSYIAAFPFEWVVTRGNEKVNRALAEVEAMAKWRYFYADAMMKARNEGEQE